MFNLILTLLLLPFVPVWSYGDLAHSTGLEKKVACAPEATICSSAAIGTEAPGVVAGESKEKKDSVAESDLFPVDATAAGRYPISKTNAQDLYVPAGASVAIDVDSGTILHYSNGRKHTQIASLTKMMTALLVMENIKDLDEEVTITRTGLNLAGTVVGCPTSVLCTSNRMFVGEKVRVYDLLRATLMNSANDAATSLAIHVSGSAEDFVALMNERAQEMGLRDTNFCTPSGLEIDGKEDSCYSSAYDIARIAAHSLKYEKIWEIMRTAEDKFYSTDGRYMHQLKSTDLIMGSTPNYLGVKTGFTPMAGKSLLAAAVDESRKHRIVAVLLNDENRWQNMKSLTDWVFANYKWQ